MNLIAKTTHGPVKNTFLLGADYDGVRDNSRFDGAFAGLVDVTNPVFPPYTMPGAALVHLQGHRTRTAG